MLVEECVCRKIADMYDKSCKSTDRRDLCMSLGDLADLYAEEGGARRIDQKEALEIARKNEEEGLVLMPGNEQDPGFTCACCSDCCGMLGLMKNLPKPAEEHLDIIYEKRHSFSDRLRNRSIKIMIRLMTKFSKGSAAEN